MAPPGELAVLRGIIAVQNEINAHLHEPAVVMDVVTASSQELTGAAGAVVEMLEGTEMVYRAVSGSAAGSLGLRLAADTSLSGQCVRERTALRCDDTERDERVDLEACRKVGVRSMVVVPLEVAPGDCVGVLKVLSPTPGSFSESTVGVLTTLATFIATSLRHAEQFEDLDVRVRRDALTGVANRAAVVEHLSAALARAGRSGEPLALLYLDLDGFKEVNDTLGHDAGDRRLVDVADALRAGVRDCDLVGRLGGDEFVVACDALGEDEAATLGRRLAAELGASVGIAMSETGDSVDTLLARADAAMYVEKRRSRS